MTCRECGSNTFWFEGQDGDLCIKCQDVEAERLEASEDPELEELYDREEELESELEGVRYEIREHERKLGIPTPAFVK